MVKSAFFLSLLVAFPAMAQDEGGGLGLDLSGDQENPPAEEQPAVQPEETPPPPPVAAATPAPEAGQPQAIGERDITQDDRVKSVQRKLYLKNNRFEVTPMVTATINDPFYLKWGGVLRVAYYLSDSLALVARGALLQTLRSNDVPIANRTFFSRIRNSNPLWYGMGDVEWSPIYGKVAMMNSIFHFDAFLVGGLGVVYPVTAGLPERSPSLGVDVGGGLRFVAKDWLAITASVINTSYVDSGPGQTTKGSMQNMLAVNAGVSIFFPFSSTGREAE